MRTLTVTLVRHLDQNVTETVTNRGTAELQMLFIFLVLELRPL